MPIETEGKFAIEHVSVLDEHGNADEALMPDLTNDDIKWMYYFMVLERTFDAKAVSLQRQGRLGTFASSLGQEASEVGSAYALSDDDWVFPSFRENGVALVRGYPMGSLFLYWMGDERGSKVSREVNMLPVSIPVGTHLLHAVGAAWGAKLKGDKLATMSYFGDGATSTGDFSEACNFAGVFHVPTVFFCQNNQYAISLPRSRQTEAKTIAQKAIAYGFEGVQVDGNDVFAVYRATNEALEKARRGGGPTLIESVTYRMAEHTTSDESSKYRNEEELKKWAARDPIKRLLAYIEKNGIAGSGFDADVRARAKEEVEGAVKQAESLAPPSPRDMFAYMFEKMPRTLEAQYRALEYSRKANNKVT